MQLIDIIKLRKVFILIIQKNDTMSGNTYLTGLKFSNIKVDVTNNKLKDAVAILKVIFKKWYIIYR